MAAPMFSRDLVIIQNGGAQYDSKSFYAVSHPDK